MQVRNLSRQTQQTYVEQVSRFARHFGQSPERLGTEQIRAYQVYLIKDRKLAPTSLTVAVAALRFLYTVHAAPGLGLVDGDPRAEAAGTDACPPSPSALRRVRWGPLAGRHAVAGVSCRLLPSVRVLTRRFQHVFLSHLQEAFDAQRLRFTGSVAALTEARAFAAQLAPARHWAAITDRAVDTHVFNLRRKIEAIPTEPRFLLGVRGLGYRFAEELTES